MKLNGFARYAWGLVVYNLGVILWGAYVRATGSGAGCGSHWPLCNGDVVPRGAQVETLIEFTHRVSSGFALVGVVALVIWARRAYPPGHIVRAGALASLLLTVTEALLGAGLVLFELVADNSSSFRAFSMVAHLVNTFLLVAALTLTAWWASGGERVPRSAKPRAMRWLFPALIGILLVGATGAVAALGDTLFPADTLVEGLRDSFSRESHPLLQLRKYHPLLAIGVGLYVVGVVRRIARSRRTEVSVRLASLVTGVYLVQLLVGVVNIVLLAPVTLQLVHLLLADALWMAAVLFTTAVPADQPDRSLAATSTDEEPRHRGAVAFDAR